MLIVKLMSDENVPDDHHSKNYELVQVGNKDKLEFRRKQVLETGTNFTLLIFREDGSTSAFPLKGNAYVMSESGKTISSHGH